MITVTVLLCFNLAGTGACVESVLNELFINLMKRVEKFSTYPNGNRMETAYHTRYLYVISSLFAKK